MQPLINQLIAMGFSEDASKRAIFVADGNLDKAANHLLEQPQEYEVILAADESSEDITEWNQEWDSLLGELSEMGFEDEDSNRHVLAECNGDVKDAVRELVQRERASREQ